MGMNRQMRRHEQRQKMREWVRTGDAERVRILSQGGITPKDLEDAQKKGYEEGYMYAATNFFKQMYAAIAKSLWDAGNDKDEIISFLVDVDDRFSVIFDADEEIDEIYDLIGIKLNVAKQEMRRIEVR